MIDFRSVGLLFALCTSASALALPSTPSLVPSVAAIADRFDAILLDQFGVLHDGKRALPGAVACFEQLAASGKRLVVLSNTSRRRAFAMSKLPGLGFDPDALAGFVCSGEEAWQHMAAHHRGQKCLWLSWVSDFHAYQGDYLEGTGVQVAPPEEADFVLCHGSQVLRTSADGAGEPTGLETGEEISAAVEAALADCVSRGLPMLCANPDLYVTLPDGTSGRMPGLLASRYEALGGKVTSFGKPYAAAFEAALRLVDTEPSRVLHVGDSLAHDVAGANAAGVASLFVGGGIHAEELGLSGGEPTSLLTEMALERTFSAHGVRPTYSVARFIW